MSQEAAMETEAPKEKEPDLDVLIYGLWSEKVHDPKVEKIINAVKEHNFIYASKKNYLIKKYNRYRYLKALQFKKRYYYKSYYEPKMRELNNPFRKRKFKLTELIKIRNNKTKYGINDPRSIYGK